MATLVVQYFSLNPAHLLDDELENELMIRSIDCSAESRSVLERKLRNELKREREQNATGIDYKACWESLITELETCDGKVGEIKQILENRRSKAAPDQKLKSRLLHIMFRMLRAKPHCMEEADVNTISEIAGLCVRLLNTYYSLISNYAEVREAELGHLNNSILEARKALLSNPENSHHAEQVDGTSQNAQAGEENLVEFEDDLADEAVGGTGERLTESEAVMLREENKQLKTLLNDVLTRLEHLESRQPNGNDLISREQPELTSNSTHLDEPNEPNHSKSSERTDPTKPKFDYNKFTSWLVKDQNLVENQENVKNVESEKKQKNPNFLNPMKRSSSEQSDFVKTSR